MSASAILQLAPGEFFGGARLSCRGHGIEVSHRIAEGPPESVVTHTHADLHFILVSGGDYVSAAGGARAAARPVLVYNPPGTTHRDHFERGRGSFFSISLEPEYAASVLPDGALPDAPCYLVQPAQHSIALGITGFCPRGTADLSLEGLCLELLGTLERRAEAAPRVPPRWLDRALQLLHDRFTEELSMPHIARSVGVHPVHLARTFRRHFHCTPGAFARLRRLQGAAQLLAATPGSLAEIAQASGFADQSHFSRAFARCFGLPPGQYRVALGGQDQGLRFDKTRLAQWHSVVAAAGHARLRAKRGR